ncbi:MAG TPA: sigma-70 family RNA polymerase sigma factor [Bacteroidota bacterium]|nr:sigma-70 family RNA polymerase sigma factor [Bacteroidota bacterium]
MSDHFTSLVKEFGPAVYRQCFGMLGSRADAEEAAQDVFMIIHNKLGTFRGDSALSTWIYTITFRCCLRRRAVKQPRFVSIDDDQCACEIPDSTPNAEAHAIGRETTLSLLERIALLPAHEAAAITLFYMEEKNYTEIGAILDMPSGTVATTLHRARRHLHALIGNREED